MQGKRLTAAVLGTMMSFSFAAYAEGAKAEDNLDTYTIERSW